MFRPVLFSLFLFLIFAQAGCYSQNSPVIADKKEAADPYLYDFGNVKEGNVFKHDFILKNDSPKPLSIKGVNTSCGCTTSKIIKDVLLPQESTLIEVSFDSKGYSGPTQQYVYVNTGSIDKPVIRLIIKANVIKN